MAVSHFPQIWNCDTCYQIRRIQEWKYYAQPTKRLEMYDINEFGGGCAERPPWCCDVQGTSANLKRWILWMKIEDMLAGDFLPSWCPERCHKDDHISFALKQRTIRRFYQGTKGKPSFSRLREEQVLESAVKSRSCKRLYVHAMCSVCTIHNLGPIVANSNRRIIQPTQLRHIKLPDPNSLVSSFRFICKIMQATITR